MTTPLPPQRNPKALPPNATLRPHTPRTRAGELFLSPHPRTRAGELFALAEAEGKLLHTAYNRRSDPAIQAQPEPELDPC